MLIDIRFSVKIWTAYFHGSKPRASDILESTLRNRIVGHRRSMKPEAMSRVSFKSRSRTVTWGADRCPDMSISFLLTK